LPVMRKRSGPAPFANRAGMICSAATLVIALVLLSRMGRAEAIVVAATTFLALVNWIWIKGKAVSQIGG